MARNPERIYAMSIAPLNSPDWKLSSDRSSALHKSGLSIFVERKQKTSRRSPAIDIKGLERLTGTQWAQKTNALVEQGLFLLEQGA
jgi:hypothetical protein